MVDEIQSHGGYATESLFKNWFRYHSYDNWGVIKVNESGIEFIGKKGNLVISKNDIKDIALVRKKMGSRVFYPFLIVIAYLLLILLTNLKFDLLNLVLLLIVLSIFFCFNYLLSNWVKVVYADNNKEEVYILYFSVSWSVGLYPNWRMWTDGSFLSWQDNRRIFKILKKSISKS